MSTKNFLIKFIVISVTFSTLTSCANLQKSDSSNFNIAARETPSDSSQKAKPNGENSPIKYAEDLETSVKQQEQPDIWLELKDNDGKILKTGLPSEMQDLIKQHWKNLFVCMYGLDHSTDYNYRRKILIDASAVVTELHHKVPSYQINTPDGKRDLTSEEMTDILTFQANLGNIRYSQLEAYFKSKNWF